MNTIKPDTAAIPKHIRTKQAISNLLHTWGKRRETMTGSRLYLMNNLYEELAEIYMSDIL